MNDNDKYTNFLKKNSRRLVLLAVALIIVLKFWDKAVKSFGTLLIAFYPLIIGIAIAYVVNILMRSYERGYTKAFSRNIGAMKMKRPLCLTAAFLSLIIIISIIMRLVVPQLIECIELLASNSGSTLRFISETMHKFTSLDSQANFLDDQIIKNFDPQDMIEKIAKFLYKGFDNDLGNVYAKVKSVISKITMVFVGIIFSIYILYGKEKLKSQFKRVLNVYLPKRSKKLIHILSVFNESFHSFIIGQVKDAMILGIMVAIGMIILRLPYPIMIGVIVAVTALIPIFGALIGAVIGMILILPTSPAKAVIFIIYFIAIQQVDNHIVYPNVVGSSTGLPSLWVLAGIAVGGSLFGMIGMLCAVPIVSAVYRLIREDISKREMKKEALSSSEE